MCDESLVQPLPLIFRGCIDTGVYPDSWKKSNILEKIIFDLIMRFLNEKKLLSDAQSGFRPSDSCEYQLLSFVHDIYESFDFNPPLEDRRNFLEISKTFDRVWYDGLIYKIKSFGISDTLSKLIENFLSNRYQRVVLNGQSSSWAEISAGISQGSVLGPLFFLCILMILAVDYHQLFVDDISLFSVVHDVTQSTKCHAIVALAITGTIPE